MLKSLKLYSGCTLQILPNHIQKACGPITFLLNRRGFSSTKQLDFKVCVVGGAGGIGQPLSLLLKLNPLVSKLTLHDIAKPTPGVAIDLSHIDTNCRVEGGFVGSKTLGEALQCAHVVVIPAGLPRKPGMTRADLLKSNAGIVYDTAQCIAEFCPDALVAIITNPVNTVVPIAAEVLKKANVFNPKKVFGVTTLDVVRTRTFVGEILQIDPLKVQVQVICGHSGKTIIPVLSQCKPALKLDPEEIEKLTKRIQTAGTEVVKAKAGAGSATLSMAHAGAKFVDSLLRALNGGGGIVECAYIKSEVTDAEFFSSPIQLGKEGVSKILEMPKLDECEQELLQIGLAELKEDIKQGKKFVEENVK